MAMKRNAEGYHDPTACDALSNVIREERRKAYRALVFICSPYAGDMEGNARRAREYCRFAVAQNCIPLAPHYISRSSWRSATRSRGALASPLGWYCRVGAGRSG